MYSFFFKIALGEASLGYLGLIAEFAWGLANNIPSFLGLSAVVLALVSVTEIQGSQ